MGKVPGRRARGRQGRRRRRSKPRARQDTTQLSVAAAKGKGKAAYPLVQVPLRADHLKAYTAGLAMAQHLLPVDLCTDPLLVLAAVISVLDTTATNENVAEVDWQKAAEVMRYLAKLLVTLTSLVDPSAPSMNNAFMPDMITRGESSRRWGP